MLLKAKICEGAILIYKENQCYCKEKNKFRKTGDIAGINPVWSQGLKLPQGGGKSG